MFGYLLLGMERQRLPGLDALRGVAATLVVFHHIGTVNGHSWAVVPYNMMVDFFFLLSGYVMARTFEERMEGDLTAVDFVIARFRRLWAPMAVGSLIGAATLLGTLGTSFIAAVMIPAILLVPIPTRLGTFPLNAPAWSIYFEILANAAHALFLYKLPTRVLAVVSTVCFIDLVVSGTGFWGTFQFGYLRVFAAYPLGIVVWRLFGDFGRWPLWPGIASLVLMPAALYEFNVPTWAEPFALLTFPCVLLCGTGLGDEERLAPVATSMGALSFPLYAIHFPILRLIAHLHGPEWLGALLSLIAALAVSVLIERRGKMSTLILRPRPEKA